MNPRTINTIKLISSLFTEEQKKLLSFGNKEVCVLTVEEQLLALYGDKYPLYGVLKTKVYAIQIIRESELIFQRLRDIQNKTKAIEDLATYQGYGVTRLVEENNLVKSDTKAKADVEAEAINFAQLKSRSGLSQYSKEFNKEGDGNKEDDNILKQVERRERKTKLRLIETEAGTKEAVLDTTAEESAYSEANISEVSGSVESTPYMQNVNIGNNRELSLNKSNSNSLSTVELTTTGDKDTKTYTYKISDSFKEMQDFKLDDEIAKILDSFAILFTDVRPCL